MIMLANDMWDGSRYLTMCMSRESYLQGARARLTRYLQLGATHRLSPLLLQLPDRWSQFWVLKITLSSDQLFDHKEVLRLAARHETNRANDRLQHLLLCHDVTLRRQFTWTWHWRLCILVGWLWRRCSPTKVPCYPPLALPCLTSETKRNYLSHKTLLFISIFNRTRKSTDVPCACPAQTRSFPLSISGSKCDGRTSLLDVLIHVLMQWVLYRKTYCTKQVLCN